MRRVKRPKILDQKECIFCCDDNYDYENDEQEDEGFNIRNMMQFDSKPLMYLGVGMALGALGVYLLRRQLKVK